jgi:hypothetical protein
MQGIKKHTCPEVTNGVYDSANNIYDFVIVCRHLIQISNTNIFFEKH